MTRVCRSLMACVATVFSLALATAANAEGRADAVERLQAVPVFFVADASGAPVFEPGLSGPAYYLTRTQASLGLGLMRGALAATGQDAEGLEIGVTDLAAVEQAPGDADFVKPVSTIDAAVAHPGVPLFIVRDSSGSPFTVRDEMGDRKVHFFLAEADARAFVARVLRDTGRDWSDIRLSVIGLDVVMNSILTSKDPSVGNWVIQPSAETRLDAASIRAEARLELP